MNKMTDRAVILLICIIALILGDIGVSSAAALLVAVTVSSLMQVFPKNKASCVLGAAYCAACGIFPAAFCCAPLILFELLNIKKPLYILAAMTIFTAAEPLGLHQTALCIGAFAVAAVLYFRVDLLEKELASALSMRDETESENQRLERRNRQLSKSQDSEIHIATLRERNRIAREIHDNVGHMLTRSILQAGALSIINKDDALREPLSSLRSTLDSAMTSIRESVHDLHDDSIDMKKVINEAVSAVDGRFEVTFDYDMGRGVPGNVKLAMIGVVREGLSNAVRHSNGDRISMILREHPAFYQLMIRDNGSCGEIRENGIGLRDMEDRAASVGGTISFTPSADGFRIFMSVPK